MLMKVMMKVVTTPMRIGMSEFVVELKEEPSGWSATWTQGDERQLVHCAKSMAHALACARTMAYQLANGGLG